MTRPLSTRFALVTVIVLLGLGLSWALDDAGASARSTLPTDARTVGESGGLLYAARPDATLLVSSDGERWLSLGALPAPATALAASPAAPATFYAATDVGLFATPDQGRRWLRAALPASAGLVSAVALDAQAPDIAYAGTVGGDLFKITDAGQHVRQIVTPALAGRRVATLAVNPVSSNLVYAVADGGLFHSHDAGESWALAAGVPTDVSALTISQVAPATLFAAAAQALWRSDDAGATWALVAPLTPAGRAVALAQDPTEPARLFAALADGSVLVSANGGLHWATIGRLPEMRGGVVLRPVTDDLPAVRLFVGGDSLLLSADPVAAAADLGAADVVTRRAAARLLAVSATPAQADALVPLLADPDSEVATFAAYALGQVQDERLTARLLDQLAVTRDVTLRQRLILALGTQRAPVAVPALAVVLANQPALARPAAEALAAIATPEAWALLLATASESAATPAQQAARIALATGMEAAAPLQLALADPAPARRALAASVLGQRGDPSAAPALRPLLTDRAPAVRAAAAEALGRLGDSEAAPTLAALQQTDPSPAVQSAAAAALTVLAARETTAEPLRLTPVDVSAPRLAASTGLAPWLRIVVLTLTVALAVLVLAAPRPRRPLSP